VTTQAQIQRARAKVRRLKDHPRSDAYKRALWELEALVKDVLKRA